MLCSQKENSGAQYSSRGSVEREAGRTLHARLQRVGRPSRRSIAQVAAHAGAAKNFGRASLLPQTSDLERPGGPLRPPSSGVVTIFSQLPCPATISGSLSERLADGEIGGFNNKLGALKADQ
jgi:hypothetical protein